MTKTKYVSKENLAKDMTGKIVVVTGGNSGIGKSTCLQLCKQGATVIIGCRKLESGQKVVAECVELKHKGKAVAMVLDIADFKSISAFVAEFNKTHDTLDLLVNNAGIMNVPKLQQTKSGFESQFGTNHIGHFVLTGGLMPALQKATSPRVVCLSSHYHDVAQGKKGRIDFEDPNFEKRPYDGWTSYSQSKLANLLFAREMAKRYPKITTVSLHPGFVESNLLKMPLKSLVRPMLRLMAGQIKPWAGVQTSLHCCLSDSLENGRYYAQVGSPSGCVGGWPCAPKDMNEEVTDDNAKKLWELSVKLTKTEYPPAVAAAEAKEEPAAAAAAAEAKEEPAAAAAAPAAAEEPAAAKPAAEEPAKAAEEPAEAAEEPAASP